MVTPAGAFYKTGLPEYSKMLAGSRLAHTDMLWYFAYTPGVICFGKVFNDFQARRIGQGFEKMTQFRYILHGLFLCKDNEKIKLKDFIPFCCDSYSKPLVGFMMDEKN